MTKEKCKGCIYLSVEKQIDGECYYVKNHGASIQNIKFIINCKNKKCDKQKSP